MGIGNLFRNEQAPQETIIPEDTSTVGKGNSVTITTDLYVSTDLHFFEESTPHRLPADVGFAGLDQQLRAYRRLSASYYAWLRTQIKKMRELELAGKIDRHDLDEMEARWDELTRIAESRVGKGTLEKATFNKNTFKPPVIKE